MHRGYIKFWRKMLDWQWYTDSITKDVFIHLWLIVSRIPTKYGKIELLPGQIVTGRKKLARELNFSEQQIRTALDKLKSTNDISIKSTKLYSIITINNWNSHQDNNQIISQANNQGATKEQPRSNQGATTNQEGKKVRIEEEVVIFSENSFLTDSENWHGEFKNVRLDKIQYGKLLTLVMNEKILNELIEDFSKEVACGKEQLWSEKLPDAHFVRLLSFWKYRKQNPDKFKPRQNKAEENNSLSFADLAKELEEDGY